MYQRVLMCIFSQPLPFEKPSSERYSRPLLTLVCFMSFRSDLAPSASLAGSKAYAVGLQNEDDSIERVQERTDRACIAIKSPILGAAVHTAQQQSCTVVLYPALIVSTEMQQLVRASPSVLLLSPALVATSSQRRSVEGSFIAFFSSTRAFVQNEASHRFRMRMLETAAAHLSAGHAYVGWNTA